MKRRLIVLILSLFVVSFLLAVPAIQGVPPSYSDQLYSLYGDWLQGKPVGLTVFHITPTYNGKPFKGELIMTVINYSSDSPKVILVKKISSSSTVAFKIQRIPVGVQEVQEFKNGKSTIRERTVFKDRSYYVGVVGIIGDKMYSGGAFLSFEPKEPITQINIPLKLKEKTLTPEEMAKLKSNAENIKAEVNHGKIDLHSTSDGVLYSGSLIDVQYTDVVLPAGVIHAAPGTKVKWCLAAGTETGKPTGLWYDSFHQIAWDAPDPHSWEKDGKKIAIAHTDSCITLDNTYSGQYKKKVVKAKVQYELDTYMIGSSWWVITEYILIPKYIWNLVDTPAYPENPPSVPSSHGVITSNPQKINFIVNKDGQGWMVQSVTLTFGAGYDAIEADVSITLYKAAGDAEHVPPYLEVYNGRGIKYWYKNNDPKSYEVYFHW
ncbi:hypothetical protein [Thermococcus sp.]